MNDVQEPDEESAPLVLESLETEDEQQRSNLTRGQAWNLYISHALSTWNARTYEFAAILFTASAYPNTLLASSLRGLFNTLVTLLLSSAIGSWIDGSKTRLRPLLLTISANRASIVMACTGWLFLVDSGPTEPLLLPGSFRTGAPIARAFLFTAVVVLGTCERLSAIGNMISMERDWVPSLADTQAVNSPYERSAYPLTHLNAVMRRIDLVCKLVAPLVVSAVVSSTSTTSGVLVVAATSIFCWCLEMSSTRAVWRKNPRLRQRKMNVEADGYGGTPDSSHPWRGCCELSHAALIRLTRPLSEYFSTKVWMPSLSLALLYFSALSYSATFITYLLNTGFSLTLITIARALGSVIEVSSTFVTPFGIHLLSRPRSKAEAPDERQRVLPAEQVVATDGKQHAVGLTRIGLWGIMLQLGTLVPVVLAIWSSNHTGEPSTHMNILARLLHVMDLRCSTLAMIAMFAFLSLSRLGLWIFDLAVQEITQTGVPKNKRSSFAGTETAFVSFFELCQWTLAAVMSGPEAFRWLVLASFGSVVCSAILYALWVRQQRGHLTHWSRLETRCRGLRRDG